MESRPLGILFACIITQCFAASTTFASLLLVSGDTSIGFAIDGSDGAPVNANNGLWFSNILGSSVTVKVQNNDTTIIAYEEVSAVPVPAAVWLFGSGLIGLVGVARRKAG